MGQIPEPLEDLQNKAQSQRPQTDREKRPPGQLLVELLGAPNGVIASLQAGSGAETGCFWPQHQSASKTLVRLPKWEIFIPASLTTHNLIFLVIVYPL